MELEPSDREAPHATAAQEPSAEAREDPESCVSSDIGRPVSYLGTILNVPQIEASVSEAINAMRPRELPVRCSNAAWYTLRTVPYQTSERAVRGWASNPFLELWSDGTEVFGRTLDELLGSRDTEPELWKRVNETVRLGRPFGEHVARHTVALGREHKLRWRARSVAAEPSRGALTLFVLDELSVD